MNYRIMSADVCDALDRLDDQLATIEIGLNDLNFALSLLSEVQLHQEEMGEPLVRDLEFLAKNISVIAQRLHQSLENVQAVVRQGNEAVVNIYGKL